MSPDLRPNAIDIVETALRDRLGAGRERPLVVGLCGSQGSGKSTLAEAVAKRFEASGLSTAILSLDDLYLPRDVREQLALSVHPLFRTRGVPGTHDVGLGLSVLGSLIEGRPTRLPRFDKSVDTPYPEGSWPTIDHPVDVVLFEGWCVGAVAGPEEALRDPVNELEREQDPDGIWRTHVQATLDGPYQQLFAGIGLQIFLAAPSFEIVRTWRTQQEHMLRAKLHAEGRDASRTMTDDQIAAFIAHYERITRQLLDEMPKRADLTIRLGPDRSVSSIGARSGLGLPI